VLWTFSRSWPFQFFVAAVGVAVALGSESAAMGLVAAVVAGFVARLGFPRAARHFYTRERNRTRPRGS
jgi:hypothetical protein